jgi:hypothetical protein
MDKRHNMHELEDAIGEIIASRDAVFSTPPSISISRFNDLKETLSAESPVHAALHDVAAGRDELLNIAHLHISKEIEYALWQEVFMVATDGQATVEWWFAKLRTRILSGFRLFNSPTRFALVIACIVGTAAISYFNHWALKTQTVVGEKAIVPNIVSSAHPRDPQAIHGASAVDLTWPLLAELRENRSTTNLESLRSSFFQAYRRASTDSVDEMVRIRLDLPIRCLIADGKAVQLP